MYLHGQGGKDTCKMRFSKSLLGHSWAPLGRFFHSQLVFFSLLVFSATLCFALLRACPSDKSCFSICLGGEPSHALMAQDNLIMHSDTNSELKLKVVASLVRFCSRDKARAGCVKQVQKIVFLRNIQRNGLQRPSAQTLWILRQLTHVTHINLVNRDQFRIWRLTDHHQVINV